MVWYFGEEGICISLGCFSQKCPVIYSLIQKDSKKTLQRERGRGVGWCGVGKNGLEGFSF